MNKNIEKFLFITTLLIIVMEPNGNKIDYDKISYMNTLQGMHNMERNTCKNAGNMFCTVPKTLCVPPKTHDCMEDFILKERRNFPGGMYRRAGLMPANTEIPAIDNSIPSNTLNSE